MEKYIEAIIEIVLEHVTCLHQIQEEHPRGPKFDNATDGIDDEQELMKKCIKAIPARLIERPEITGEFIEKKARKLHQEVYGSLNKCDFKCHMMETFRKQIKSLFNEESK